MVTERPRIELGPYPTPSAPESCILQTLDESADPLDIKEIRRSLRAIGIEYTEASVKKHIRNLVGRGLLEPSEDLGHYGLSIEGRGVVQRIRGKIMKALG